MSRDERQHAAVVKAVVSAGLGQWSAYDYDEVPGTPQNADEAQRTERRPAIYVLVTVERRFGGARRVSGASAATGWRITARAVGTTIDEARWAMQRVAAVLEDQHLVIAERATTPVAFESGQSPEPDDGLFSALSVWTYVH